jgi:hypothetical protein
MKMPRQGRALPRPNDRERSLEEAWLGTRERNPLSGCIGRLVATAVAVLAAFATGLGGTLRVVLEVAPTHMATFLAGLGSTLGVFREIAFTAAMFSHF